jgi:ATP-dependent protease ClpP protease subunit
MTNVYPLKCRIRNDAGVTRVDVYDDIGEGCWFSDGVSAKDFAAQLAPITGPLEIHINSAGGDVFDGIAISSAIRAHSGRATTVVDGLAASIASVIAQAGQERIVQPGSMLMIHDAAGMCIGDAAEMAQMRETLDKVSDNIASIYASRSGRDQAYWRDQMKAETWYTADEAVAAGLADRAGDGEASLPAGMDLAALGNVPGRIAARLRTLPAAAPGRPQAAAEKSCEELGHQCCTDAAAAKDRSRARVLGLESMPLADKALPVHHTATEDSPWDGPAAVAAMPNDDTVLKYCHAWEDSEAAATPHEEGDDDADDQKGNYKFPHHKTKGGPANLAACRNGLGRLPGAHIPDGDRAGVKAHLQAHLDDGGKDGDGADDHAHPDISGLDLGAIAAGLKGAFA